MGGSNRLSPPLIAPLSRLSSPAKVLDVQKYGIIPCSLTPTRIKSYFQYSGQYYIHTQTTSEVVDHDDQRE